MFCVELIEPGDARLPAPAWPERAERAGNGMKEGFR
jgi:hypothetical protein